MKTLPPALAALLLLAACKKDTNDPDGLPPATQEGKKTAGFLLNGKPWLPKISPLNAGSSPVGAFWSPYITQGGRRLSVAFSRYQDDSNEQSFSFYLSDIRQAGTFEINQYINPNVISGPRPPYAVYSILSPSPRRRFYSGSDARGQVIISRFDTLSRVISGTFHTTVKGDGGLDSLVITEGRFDAKF